MGGWDIGRLGCWEIEAADWDTGNLAHWQAGRLNHCGIKTLKISKLGGEETGTLTHWNIGKLGGCNTGTIRHCETKDRVRLRRRGGREGEEKEELALLKKSKNPT